MFSFTVTPQAELDGLRFRFKTLSETGGERYDIKQHPGRDVPTIQSLGKQHKRMTIVAAFDDATDGISWRDSFNRLVIILERGGPYRLFDPIHNVTRAVIVESYEKRIQGELHGRAEVMLNFADASSNTIEIVRPRDQFTFEFSVLGELIKGAFAARIRLTNDNSGTTDATTNDLTSRFVDLAMDMQAARLTAGIQGDEAGAWIALEEIFSSKTSIQGGGFVKLGPLAVGLKPGQLEAMFSWGEGSGEALADYGISQKSITILNANRSHSFRSWPPLSAISGVGQNRVRRENRSALSLAVRASALLAFMQVNINSDWREKTNAEAVMNTTSQAMVKLKSGYGALGKTNAAELSMLSKLRSAHSSFIGHMRVEASNLPRRKKRQLFGRALPSLVAAYQLTGHVDTASQIVAMNDVRHPGFVPQSVQVLQRNRKSGEFWD